MERIDGAFRKVRRSAFLPIHLRPLASMDRPLYIGHGATNSQPSTVRMMLDWLDPQPGEKVLDVGSGSGWTSALLGHLVGPEGKVYAVEIVPELVEMGQENLRKAKVKNVEVRQAKRGVHGLPEEAPFDRILVSASADELPRELVEQLDAGGVMVVPVENDVLVVTKNDEGDFDIQSHPGFAFVPLV